LTSSSKNLILEKKIENNSEKKNNEVVIVNGKQKSSSESDRSGDRRGVHSSDNAADSEENDVLEKPKNPQLTLVKIQDSPKKSPGFFRNGLRGFFSRFRGSNDDFEKLVKEEEKLEQREEDRIVFVLPEHEVLATCCLELPADVIKVVKSSNISLEELDAQFATLLNILHFKRIYPPRNSKLKIAFPTPCRPPVDLEESRATLLTSGNPKKMYKIQASIGKGGFGRVFVGKGEKNKKVAIKRIPNETAKQQRNNFIEIKFLSTIRHPNVVEYISSWSYKNEIWVAFFSNLLYQTIIQSTDYSTKDSHGIHGRRNTHASC